MINRSRGSPALMKFFVEEFAGTLVTDFWGAYNAVVCALRQTCLVHLLRELDHTEQYKSPGEHWPEFAKKLRRLVGDAIRLWRVRAEMPEETYASRRASTHDAVAGVACHALEGSPRQAADQASATPSERPVHVPGSTRRSFRQQHRRTGRSPRGDHPQKQLRQSQRARGGLPIGPHVSLPHPQTTRPRSYSNHYQCLGVLPHHRSTSPTP